MAWHTTIITLSGRFSLLWDKEAVMSNKSDIKYMEHTWIHLEALSKMSFGLPPLAGLVPRFKSSIRLRRTSGLRPTNRRGSDGKSSSAGDAP